MTVDDVGGEVAFAGLLSVIYVWGVWRRREWWRLGAVGALVIATALLIASRYWGFL